jgi:hypothetical protein
VDFLHIHAKNPDYPACFRSLQGIKIHFREFLYGFMREAQQTPSWNKEKNSIASRRLAPCAPPMLLLNS